MWITKEEMKLIRQSEIRQRSEAKRNGKKVVGFKHTNIFGSVVTQAIYDNKGK